MLSAVLKVIGLSTSLLIVPITIKYLDKEVYGIWMTMTSVLFWIGGFDIGLGNGMRNYLAESISEGNFALGRKYISTSFSLIALVACILALLASIPLSLLDFNDFFNTTAVSGFELRSALTVAVGFTLVNFVLKNVGYIFVALQKYALNDFLTVLGNVISLFIIFLLTRFTHGNLMYVVLAYTATSSLIYVIAAVPLFLSHPELKPTKKDFDKSLGKQIVGKGLGFFIIQITSCIVIFGAANVFIAQYCGPVDVTVYNVAYKYFNLLIIAYTIILAPVWNAYTDAYVKDDMVWINKTFVRTLKFWGLSVFIGAFMLLLSNLFYRLWVGGSVNIPLSISICTYIYVCSFNLNNCATYLINGLNKIRVQVITSLVFTALYVLTVNSFGYKLGADGIVLSMASCYTAMALIHLYQCWLLIHKRASGIWNL